MPASTVTLTVLEQPADPRGPTTTQQQSTAVAGNSFPNDGQTMLLVRNANAAARTLTFFADIIGAERTIMTREIPGSGTVNGLAVLGPFPRGTFNDHNVTHAAKNGHVMFTHSGADADIQLTPFRLNRSLSN